LKVLQIRLIGIQSSSEDISWFSFVKRQKLTMSKSQGPQELSIISMR